MKILLFIFSSAFVSAAFSQTVSWAENLKGVSPETNAIALKVEEQLEYLKKEFKPQNLDGKDAAGSSYVVLCDKERCVVYSSAMPENMTLYCPPEFRADLIDNTRMANIFPGGFSEMFDPSLYNIIYLAASPRGVIASIEKAAKEKSGEVGVENGALTVSYGSFTYVFFAENGRIGEIEIIKNATGEVFMKVALKYGGSAAMSAQVDYFYEREPVIRKTYSVSAAPETPAGIAACFDSSDMGAFKFADMRFSPPIHYEYDGGIPAMAQAQTISEAMKVFEIRKTMNKAWVSADKRKVSPFFGRVMNIVEALGED